MSTGFETAVLRVQARGSAAHYAVMEANFLTAGAWAGNPRYDRLVARIDRAVVALSVGKWYLGRAADLLGGLSLPSYSMTDLARAEAAFDDAERIADAARIDRDAPLAETYHASARAGTEILWADEAPIVPAISPIVVLRGSSVEMGRQYAAQIIEIFGAVAFAAYAGHAVAGEERDIVAAWREQLARHAPEIIDYAKGMAAGASAAGLPMTEAQALAMWTGLMRPATRPEGIRTSSYYGLPVDEMPTPCSGCCAWGDATVDGELYLGASTDHDCTLQATVVAYPDDGHAFIYTPFAVNGFTTTVGDAWFAGHPGINAAGLAYVQHGGGAEGCTDPSDWSYGVRRGATTFHALRHFSDARAVREYELGLPAGDGGRILGTAGGFYADRSYGYVLESRRAPPVIRETTARRDGRNMNLLYANNNNIDPRSGDHWCPPADGYRFEPEAGWFTLDQPPTDATPGEVTRLMTAKASESRNRYYYNELSASCGRIDLDSMTRLYQQGPRLPERPWTENEAAWRAGERFKASVAHRQNAFVSSAAPRADGTGRYRGCIGPTTHRSVPPYRAGHGYIYVDETNESWELVLAETPERMLDHATAEADRRIADAEDVLRAAKDDLKPGLGQLLRRAASERAGEAQADGGSADLARRLRSATRAQVRAAQLITAATDGQRRGS